MNTIERVCDWNSLRYDQEYDHNLSCELLKEEVIELIFSKHDVDKLDALVDIIFVAIGAMWKLGLNPTQIEKAINVVCDSNDSKSVQKPQSHVKANINKGANFIPPEPKLQEILNER